MSNLDHQTASIKSNRHRPVHIPNYSKPEVPVPPVHYPLPIPTPSYPNYPQPIPIDIVTINPPSVPGGHGGYEIPPEIPEATFRPSPPWSHPEEEISHPEPIPEPIISSFSCIGRYYGYYADVENDCTVFHVCNPTYTATGYPEVQQASFRCGPGSVFSQQKLTCVHPHQTEPCHTSPDFYSVNEEFGKIQVRNKK